MEGEVEGGRTGNYAPANVAMSRSPTSSTLRSHGLQRGIGGQKQALLSFLSNRAQISEKRK